MIRAQDVEQLRDRMDQARQRLMTGRLSEDEAWQLLDRASRMLEEAADGPWQANLEVIYSLLCSLWRVSRGQQQMNRAFAAVCRRPDRS